MWAKSGLAILLACLGGLLAIGCAENGSRVELTLNEKLAYACMEGDFDGVNDLLLEGADANGGDDMKGVPLMFALFEGHYTIAGILVDSGADVNVRLDNGGSLLDTLIRAQAETDNKVEEAKLELAIDKMYEMGARRPPE